MPTAPTPGITYFGSSANTMFGSSLSFERGVSTGSFVYLDADAVPHEFGLLLGPHEVGAESLFFGDFGSYLIEFGTRCSRPGDIFDLAFDKQGLSGCCPVSNSGSRLTENTRVISVI